MTAAEHPFLRAMRPVAEAIGATVVPVRSMRPSDIPLEWEGEVVGGLRIRDLHGAMERLVTAVELELGGPLHDLSREDKQRAVRLLDERGAFLLRRAADEIADRMGVSRITIYNYLNAISGSARAAG